MREREFLVVIGANVNVVTLADQKNAVSAGVIPSGTVTACATATDKTDVSSVPSGSDTGGTTDYFRKYSYHVEEFGDCRYLQAVAG